MGPQNQFTFCRLCLCPSASLTDIFDVGNNHGYLLKETIEDLLQFKVIRVVGCPWLTCDNCLEKLHDFRLFKTQCIESKVAFENRFPQQPILLMPNIMNMPMNDQQKPTAVLLLPVSSNLTLAENVRNLPLESPSLCQLLTTNCNPSVSDINRIISSDQFLGRSELSEPEVQCRMNENVTVTKMGLAGFKPGASCEEALDDGGEEALDCSEWNTDDVQIEETEVKDFIPLECDIGSRVGLDGDMAEEVNAGSIIHADASLVKTSGANIRSDMLPEPIAMIDKRTDLSCEREVFVAVIKEGQRNIETRSPCSPSVLSLDHPCAHSDPTDENSSPVLTDSIEIGLSSMVEEEAVTRLDRNQSSNSGNLCDTQASGSLERKHKGVKKRIRVKCPIERQKVFECLMCLERFPCYRDLIRHKHSHADDPKPYKCPMCTKTYSNYKSRMVHRKSHYNVPQMFECEFCELRFQFRHLLTFHLRSHKTKGPFQCKICGQVFKSPQVLSRHKIKHSKPQFPCSHCDKEFFRRFDLNQHLLLHNNEKTFRCLKCDKGFNSRSLLRCHLQLHNEDKRYCCEECGIKFAQYASLWQHRKRHQGNKKFVCDVCGKGFVLNCLLRQHAKIHKKSKKE